MERAARRLLPVNGNARRSRSPDNRIAFYLLGAAVVGAPVLFGSVDIVPIALWCIVLGFAAIAASHEQLTAAHIATLVVPLALSGLYAVVVHEQMSPHPWWASPQPIWTQASDVLGVPLTAFASVTPTEPWFALGSALVSLLALIGGLIVGADRHRARQLLLIVAWSGAIQALFAILSFVFEPGMILWRHKQSYLNNLTGTFVNRNTAAIYFGSSAVVWIVLLSERVRHYLPRRRITVGMLRRYIFNAAPVALLRPLAAFFVCLFAMFMTGSRAGITLSCAAIAGAFFLYWRRDLARAARLKAIIAAAFIALIAMQLMGGLVSSRFGRQGVDDEGRIETYRATLALIRDAPWFGTGAGSFAWSFPAYRSAKVSMWGVWDLAHSTPLEIAADMGVPFAAAVTLAWAAALIVLVRGIRCRRRELVIPVAAFAIAVLALLHSAIDFTLQIPGYAIGFFILIGAGLAQSLRPKAPDGGATGSAVEV